jgi:hypothetical protein
MNCTTKESALLKRLTILGFPTDRIVLQLTDSQAGCPTGNRCPPRQSSEALGNVTAPD